MSTRTRESPRTPSRTGSSRTPSRPRSAARRRSSRSTTPARARRRRPSGRSSPGCASGERPRSTTAAIDYAVSLAISGHMDDPIAELPAMVDAGRLDREGIHGLRLPARRVAGSRRCGVLGSRGGMLQVHCEDPVLIDAAVAVALAAGDTAPQFHASTRSTEAEAVATHRVMAFARAADVPVHVVHLSSAAALRHVREAKARGRTGPCRDVPALPRPDRRALRSRRRPRLRRGVRDLAAAAARPTRTRSGPASPPARST